jgi:hypothetical protein
MAKINLLYHDGSLNLTHVVCYVLLIPGILSIISLHLF